jgi:hypothetical protein
LYEDDEPPTTEITILPDGRICVFGASRQVLEALDQAGLSDAALRARLEYLDRVEPAKRCPAMVGPAGDSVPAAMTCREPGDDHHG